MRYYSVATLCHVSREHANAVRPDRLLFKRLKIVYINAARANESIRSHRPRGSKRFVFRRAFKRLNVHRRHIIVMGNNSLILITVFPFILFNCTLILIYPLATIRKM